MGNYEERLNELALKKSNPFCYSCYKEVKKEKCDGCGSDDLMREVKGVGVEYGVDWIIKHLLNSNLNPVDEEEFFDNFLEDSYGCDFSIGPWSFPVVDTIKTMDHILYKNELSNYISSLEEDGIVVSFDYGENYYHVDELDSYLTSEGV